MGTPRKQGSLYTRISGPLAVVEFGHPASNSLNSELLGRLCDEIHALGNNPEVSVLLLQSEGDRAFCAGASFDELLQVSTPEQSAAFFSPAYKYDADLLQTHCGEGTRESRGWWGRPDCRM